jgi:hypothetical protein
MASTRNKNTYINYKLEQLTNMNNEMYNLYKHGSSGDPYYINLPGNGFGGSHMSADKLSNNSVDIESFLRGIGTTDLIKGPMTLTPKLNTISTVNIYETNNPVIMPLPLITTPERPWPI